MKMQLAISVFLIAYIFIASERFNRVAVALIGAASMIVIGATDADAIYVQNVQLTEIRSYASKIPLL